MCSFALLRCPVFALATVPNAGIRIGVILTRKGGVVNVEAGQGKTHFVVDCGILWEFYVNLLDIAQLCR